MRGQVRLLPLKQGDVELLEKLAREDNHSVIAPSFTVVKEQSVVGYIGIVPSVVVWMGTHKTNVRDSLSLMNSFENYLAMQGQQVIGVPCVEESPYLKYLPEAGYLQTHSRLFMKNLNP